LIKRDPEILVYGIGNPGRQDDALGLLLTEKIEKWARKQNYRFIHTEQTYQLNIEDAELISHYDLIVFLDASVRKDVCCDLIEKVIPQLRTDFSMHSVTPSFVAGLAEKLFSGNPEVFQMHIKACEFNFMEPLTPKAEENLENAFNSLKDFIERRLNKSF